MVGSEVAAKLYSEHPGQDRIVSDFGMAVQWQVRGVNRDVPFYETRKTTKGGSDDWSEPAPKQPVMNKEAIGVLFGCLPNGGLAEVDGRRETTDVTRIADLQTIQRLGRVGDFLSDAEIFVEKSDQIL